jgi:hypothetical protein
MVFVKTQKNKKPGTEDEYYGPYYYLYESYYDPSMEYPTNFKVGKVGEDTSTLVSNLKEKASDKDIDLDQEDIDHFKIQLRTVEEKAEQEGVDEDEIGEFYKDAFSGELGEDEQEEDSGEEKNFCPEDGRRFVNGHCPVHVDADGVGKEEAVKVYREDLKDIHSDIPDDLVDYSVDIVENEDMAYETMERVDGMIRVYKFIRDNEPVNVAVLDEEDFNKTYIDDSLIDEAVQVLEEGNFNEDGFIENPEHNTYVTKGYEGDLNPTNISEEKSEEATKKWVLTTDNNSLKKFVLIEDGVETNNQVSVKIEEEDGKGIYWDWDERVQMSSGIGNRSKKVYGTDELKSKLSRKFSKTSANPVSEADWSDSKLALESVEGWEVTEYGKTGIELRKTGSMDKVEIHTAGNSLIVSYETGDESNVTLSNSTTATTRSRAVEMAESVIDDIENDEVDDERFMEEFDEVDEEEVDNLDEKLDEMARDLVEREDFKRFVDAFNTGDWERAVDEGWDSLSDSQKEYLLGSNNAGDGVPDPVIGVPDTAMVVLFYYRPSGINPRIDNLEYGYEAKYFIPYNAGSYKTADVSDPSKVLDSSESSLYSKDYIEEIDTIYDQGYRAFSGIDFPVFFSPKGEDKTGIVLAPRIEEN